MLQITDNCNLIPRISTLKKCNMITFCYFRITWLFKLIKIKKDKTKILKNNFTRTRNKRKAKTKKALNKLKEAPKVKKREQNMQE